MNWTEGSLTRHCRKKGRNEELLRQQKYFAQNRTKKHSNGEDSAASLDNFIPSYILRATIPQSAANDATIVSKHSKNRAKATSAIDHRTFPSLSASLPLSSVRDKYGTPTAQASSVQRATAVELNAKREKLLQQQDWAGIVTGDKIGFRIEAQNYDDGNNEESHNWNVKKRRRSRAKAQLAPQHSRSKKGPTKISIGSQRYQWSPGKNSANTNLDSQLSSNHQSSTRARKRVAPGSRPSPPSLTSHSRRSQSSCRQTRVPVSPSSSLKIRSSSIGKGHETGDGCDKPQLIVISCPQLICHPRPTASLSSFNIRHPNYELYPESSHEPDTGEDSNGFLESIELLSAWQDQLLSSQPKSPLAQERWKNTSDAGTVETKSKETCPSASPNMEHEMLRCENVSARPAQSTIATPISDAKQGRSDIAAIGAPEEEQGNDNAIWKAFIHENDKRTLTSPEILSNKAHSAISTNAVEASEHEAPMSRPSDECPEPGQSITNKSGVPDAAPPRCISVEAPVSRYAVASSDQASPSDTAPALPSSTAATGDKGEAVTSASSNTFPSENKLFRFHKPKLFVGRLASNGLSAKSNTGFTERVAKKRGGKTRKRKRGNQVDIRSLPNFSDDPIEEDVDV